jgi:hypothetical protein
MVTSVGEEPVAPMGKETVTHVEKQALESTYRSVSHLNFVVNPINRRD